MVIVSWKYFFLIWKGRGMFGLCWSWEMMNLKYFVCLMLDLFFIKLVIVSKFCLLCFCRRWVKVLKLFWNLIGSSFRILKRYVSWVLDYIVYSLIYRDFWGVDYFFYVVSLFILLGLLVDICVILRYLCDIWVIDRLCYIFEIFGW